MRTYARDARSALLTNVAGALAALGTQSLLAWALLPAGRGEFAACMLFASLLALGFALGQEMSNVYFVGSGRLTPSQAMTQSVVLALAFSVVGCAAGYAVTCTGLGFLDKAPLPLFRLALLWVPVNLLQLYLTRLLLGMGEVRAFNLLATAPAVLSMAGMAAVSVWGTLSVRRAVELQIGGLMLAAVLAAAVLTARHGCRLVPLHAAELTASLGYGVRFYVGKLASMANVQMGAIILMLCPVTAAELGMFSAAAALAGKVWMVADSLQTAMLPRSAADPQGRCHSLAQCVRLCLLCTAAAIGFLFVVSRPIIAIVLSPRFLPVLLPFQLLLPGILVRVISKLLSAYFNGIGRPGVTSTAVTASLLTNIALMYLLIPVWGLTGVSASMVAAYTLEAAIMAACFCRSSGLPLGALLRLSGADVRLLLNVLRRMAIWRQGAPTAVVG